jgi:hypothetical protein
LQISPPITKQSKQSSLTEKEEKLFEQKYGLLRPKKARVKKILLWYGIPEEK